MCACESKVHQQSSVWSRVIECGTVAKSRLLLPPPPSSEWMWLTNNYHVENKSRAMAIGLAESKVRESSARMFFECLPSGSTEERTGTFHLSLSSCCHQFNNPKRKINKKCYWVRSKSVRVREWERESERGSCQSNIDPCEKPHHSFLISADAACVYRLMRLPCTRRFDARW